MWKRWKRGFRPVPAGQIPTEPVLVCLVFIVAGLFENRGKRISRGPFVAKREKCGNFPHTFHREKTDSFPQSRTADPERCRRMEFSKGGNHSGFPNKENPARRGPIGSFLAVIHRKPSGFHRFSTKNSTACGKVGGNERRTRKPYFLISRWISAISLSRAASVFNCFSMAVMLEWIVE